MIAKQSDVEKYCKEHGNYIGEYWFPPRNIQCKTENGEKKFTKKQMLAFAETCMLDLLSTKPENSEYNEISALDLHRIKQVLCKFKKIN